MIQKKSVMNFEQLQKYLPETISTITRNLIPVSYAFPLPSTQLSVDELKTREAVLSAAKLK